MRYADINGNADVRAALAGMVSSGKTPHAIMFHEDDGGGAFPIVMAFLQHLYCRARSGKDSCGECPECGKVSKLIHPDIHFVFPVAAGTLSESYYPQLRDLVKANPSFSEAELGEALGIEGKNSIISVAQSRDLLSKLSLSSLEGGYRSVVIYLPEKMNQEAANRLLKLIEEPPLQTQFLLITHAPEKVLVTIASRCQRIRVVPSSQDASAALKEYPEFDELMDLLIARNLFGALELAESLAALPSRENAKAFCAWAGHRLRDIFLAQQGLAAADPKVGKWAAGLKKTFPRAALDAFSRAGMLIDRNVNLKILFSDLVNRLYVRI